MCVYTCAHFHVKARGVGGRFFPQLLFSLFFETLFH